MTVKTLSNGEIVTSRPRSMHTAHYMEFDGKHPALVDAETWAAARSRFVSDRTKSGYQLRNPLAGVLRCQKCGKTLAYQAYQSDRKENYRPRYTHRQSQLCSVKSIIADDVINAVVRGLKDYIADFELKIDNLPAVDENSVKGQIELLQTEMRKTERKLAKLFDAWENEDISNNEFVERKAVNNKKIASIKAQIAELEDTIPAQEEFVEIVERLHTALDALTDPDIDADIKNEFIKAIIERIDFSRDTGDTFNLDIYLKP